MAEDILVLHVDDNPDFVDLSIRHLEDEGSGFTVQTATSADEALDLLSDAVDCVVSDYEMPGTNGIELLEDVRDLYPDLPFILFTGKGSEEIASDAISAGVTDYLRKRTGTEQYDLLATRVETAVGQYRAERQLARQNDLFAKAQDLADVGAWEWEPQAEQGYYTDQVYEIYGVDTDYEGAPAKDIRAFYHPEDRDMVQAAVDAAIESGENFDIEARITSSDGTEKWVRVLGDPHYEDGACQLLRGTIRDITDRKQREQELENTTEWYQTLLDTAPDAIFVADGESGEILETNQAATRLLDRPREEIVGMHQTDLHPPERAQEYAGLFEEHVESGAGRDVSLGNQVDIYVRDADGDQTPVEINARTVQIGETYVNQGYFRDITDRKERERELERQNERLDDFVSVISHDLRNPLRTLSLSLAQLETDDEEALDRCRQSVDRMDRLIEDLLTLARQGETNAEREPLSLAEVSGESWQTVVSPAAEFSVESDPTIVADQGRLKQLFENLFSNAIEHGSEDVSITVGSIDDGFYVEDDGAGIPSDRSEQCFEIGYSTSDSGTGFGLNIVKQVVASHGWDIRVTESEEGGARFEITGVARR